MTARLLVAVVLTLAGVWMLPAPAYACSCEAKSDDAYAAQADVVFTGFIARNNIDRNSRLRTVTFRVQQVYKGSAYLNQVVTMYWDHNSCGVEFFGVDPPYTVFARQEQTGLVTDACSGTVFGSVPASLGPGRPPQPGPPPSETRRPASWVALAGTVLVVSALSVVTAVLVRRRRVR